MRLPYSCPRSDQSHKDMTLLRHTHLYVAVLMTSLTFLVYVIFCLYIPFFVRQSTDELLRRVRANSTSLFSENPLSSIHSTSAAVSILEEIETLGWKTERISVRFHTSHIHDPKRTGMIVPNVVHYVWLGSDLKFTFIHYLSFRSVHRFIRPDFIFVYGEAVPTGTWWDRTIQDVDNIYHVHRPTPLVAPSGRAFRYKAHASDLMRTQIVHEFGGIYLDADVIVLKSFDALRRYQTVMGRERSDGICNGIIISVKKAPFVSMLLEQYKDYMGIWEQWSYRSVIVPHILAEEFPSLIHVEETGLNRPNYMEIGQIFDEDNIYNWTENFSIHLWVRMQKSRNKKMIAKSPEHISCLRTTLGEIARLVYFGSSALRCS